LLFHSEDIVYTLDLEFLWCFFATLPFRTKDHHFGLNVFTVFVWFTSRDSIVDSFSSDGEDIETKMSNLVDSWFGILVFVTRSESVL